MASRATLLLLVGLALPWMLSAQGARHILYGDFEVDEGEAPPDRARTYQLTLERIPGGVVGRLNLPPSGRYRFMDVSNGDYELVIELGNREVARLRFRIDEFRSTDIRRDLQLSWSELGGRQEGPPAGLVYARAADNQRRFRKASGLIERGELKEASEVLEQLLAEDPQDYEAWSELGTVHFRRQRLTDAGDAYRVAVEVEPRFPLGWLNLGKLHLAGKRYGESQAALERFLALVPESAQGHYLMGEALLGARLGSKAVEHFREALRIAPREMADAHLRLGALFQAAGRSDLAVAEYRHYLQIRPDSPMRSRLEKYISRQSRQKP